MIEVLTSLTCLMSQPKFQSPKGVHDVLPEDHLYFSFIKKVVRHHCRRAGFRRISTPMFEDVEAFKRSIGESSDIVEKEMFLFESKSGRKFALKPEGTAGVVRAYLEHGMANLPKRWNSTTLNRIFVIIALKKAVTGSFINLVSK